MKNTKTPEGPPVLGPTHVTEIIRTLDEGGQIGKSLNVERFGEIIGVLHNLLWPLVAIFDKELYEELRGLRPFPKTFKKKRCMHILSDSGVYLGLQRSGLWMVCIRGGQLAEADDLSLATILGPWLQDRFPISHRVRKDVLDRFLVHDKRIMDASRYLAILKFIASCVESVSKQIQEREKRLEFMKERLNLLSRFSEALDPVASSDTPITLPGWSIFQEHERGTGRCTSTYHDKKALEEFWIVVRERTGQKFFEQGDSKRCGSLDDLFSWIARDIEEILKTPPGANARSLFCFSTGRLPFTTREIELFVRIFDSLKTQP